MLAKDFKFRVSARRLLAGLIVAFVPLIAVSLYIVNKADDAWRESTGSQFEALAKISSSEVARYVHDRVISCHVLAGLPTVVEAVQAANRRNQSESDAAFQARVERTEQIWGTAAANPLVTSILDAPASRLFRAEIAVDSRLLRMILTDARGAVIAASHKTLDYYQADEEPWQAAYAAGRGAVYASEVRFDPVTQHNFVYLALPVAESASVPFIGVLEVLIDVAGLLPQESAPPSGSFRRLLVTGEGRVVTGPGVQFSMDVSSPEFAALRDAGAARPGTAGFLISQAGTEREELIGYADTGLSAELPNLDLRVLVAQATDETSAGTVVLTRLILINALVAIVLLTLATVYFSLHHPVRYEDVAPALPPESSS